MLSSATYISERDATTVAITWLERNNNSPMNLTLGSSIKTILHYPENLEGQGYYLVILNPNGWLVIPSDSSYEAILMFGQGFMTPEIWESSLMFSMLSQPTSEFNDSMPMSSKMNSLAAPSDADTLSDMQRQNRWQILLECVHIKL